MLHAESCWLARVLPAQLPTRALGPEPLAQAAWRQAGAVIGGEAAESAPRPCITAPRPVLAESLRIAHQAGALRGKDLERVTVDTTVQPKAISFPTDAKLLHAAIRA